MKLFVSAVTFVAFALLAPPAQAKCYHFSDSPSDVYVCVGKNGSDSQKDRELGQKICSEKTGKKCGGVSSHSSSCHSNSNQCFDETGKANRDLKGY